MARPRRPRRRLLFVCTANQHRSRTAVDVFQRDPRVEVRSAGTDVNPWEPDEQPVTEELLRWAHIVFVMEPYHQEVLEERFPSCRRRTVVLDIEDRYVRGDPDLVRLLRERVPPFIRSSS